MNETALTNLLKKKSKWFPFSNCNNSGNVAESSSYREGSMMHSVANFSFDSRFSPFSADREGKKRFIMRTVDSESSPGLRCAHRLQSDRNENDGKICFQCSHYATRLLQPIDTRRSSLSLLLCSFFFFMFLLFFLFIYFFLPPSFVSSVSSASRPFLWFLAPHDCSYGAENDGPRLLKSSQMIVLRTVRLEHQT